MDNVVSRSVWLYRARAATLARAVRRYELLVLPSFDAEVGEHELRNVVPELGTHLDIDPRVLSRVDSAQAGLGRYIAVAGKGPYDAWQDIGGDPDLILLPEEGGQHGRCGPANHAVGGWIRGIRCGGGERCPGRVADDRRIPGRIGLADGRDGPPQLVVILGVVEGDGAVGEGQVEHREQARGGLQVRVARQGGVLGDLIPGVPDRPCPELADHGLLRRPRRAGVLTQALDLVDGLRIRLAGQCGGRSRAELRRVVQHKGGHVPPVGENGCRELRRRELVIARLVARHEGWRRGGGTVSGAHGEQARGDSLADLASLLLAGSIRDRGELTGELLIERRLPLGVERHQGVMAGRGCCGIGPGAAGSGYREEVGRGIPGDGDDGVVDRRVQDGEAARRVNGGRLSTGRLDDVEQLLIPGDDDGAGAIEGVRGVTARTDLQCGCKDQRGD